jgi:hypothetical protein
VYKIYSNLMQDKTSVADMCGRWQPQAADNVDLSGSPELKSLNAQCSSSWRLALYSSCLR